MRLLAAATAAGIYFLGGLAPSPAKAETPLLWTADYPLLNATSPYPAKCGVGLGEVMAEALGLNITMGSAITSLLGGFTPATAETLVEVTSALKERTRRSRAMLQSPTTKKQSDKGAAAVYPSLERWFDRMAEAESALLDTAAVVAANAAVQGLLPESLMQELAPLLLYLMSPTWNEWLGRTLGVGHGGVWALTGADTYNYTADSNLLQSYADAVTYAHEHEPDLWRRLCSIQNFVTAFIACSKGDSPFDEAKQCGQWTADNPAPVPAFTLPATCKYTDASGAAQTIDFTAADLVYDPFFADLRATSPNGETPRLLESIDPDDRVKLFALFRAQATLSQYLELYSCNITDYGAPLPGWKVLDVLSYTQPGNVVQTQKPRPEVPILAVARPVGAGATDQQKCDVLILTRGTTNSFEWGVDVDFALVPFPGIANGHGHRGFNRMASAVMPQLQEVLYRIQADTGCASLRIMTSGHSLGGGMANIVAYRLAVMFPQHHLNAAAFASPNVFDRAAADHFAKLVNSRGLRADADPVPRAPLAIQMTPYSHPTCNLVADVPGEEYMEVHEAPGNFKYDIRPLMGQTAGVEQDWFQVAWHLNTFGTQKILFPGVPEADWVYIHIPISGATPEKALKRALPALMTTEQQQQVTEMLAASSSSSNSGAAAAGEQQEENTPLSNSLEKLLQFLGAKEELVDGKVDGSQTNVPFSALEGVGGDEAPAEGKEKDNQNATPMTATEAVLTTLRSAMRSLESGETKATVIRAGEAGEAINWNQMGLYLFLRFQLPLALQIQMSHVCSYNCWGAVGCNGGTSEGLTECSTGCPAVPMQNILIALTL